MYYVVSTCKMYYVYCYVVYYPYNDEIVLAVELYNNYNNIIICHEKGVLS